jgi:hypothetical protein
MERFIEEMDDADGSDRVERESSDELDASAGDVL